MLELILTRFWAMIAALTLLVTCAPALVGGLHSDHEDAVGLLLSELDSQIQAVDNWNSPIKSVFIVPPLGQGSEPQLEIRNGSVWMLTSGKQMAVSLPPNVKTIDKSGNIEWITDSIIIHQSEALAIERIEADGHLVTVIYAEKVLTRESTFSTNRSHSSSVL